jgi:uncharacterized protein YjiK
MTRSAIFVFALHVAFISAEAIASPPGFQKIDEITLPTHATPQNVVAHHGIAFDAGEWHVANPFTNAWFTYDAGFHFLRMTAEPILTRNYGLSIDPASGHLFLSDATTGGMVEVTKTGTLIRNLSIPGAGITAVAYDGRDDSLWVLNATLGQIQHRTRAGGPIASFTTGVGWTGMTLDPVHNTLLLLTNEFDELQEYSTSGSFLGTLIPGDIIPDNGQGLAYDPALGRLYVTSQSGIVSVFEDPSRAVPEPSAVKFLICLFTLAACLNRQPVWRHFRRCRHIRAIER